jgi:tRNA(Arg) A34 adenosine deaminase TadA
MTDEHTGWMRAALAEAEKAAALGDVPIGAVAVRDDAIVGRLVYAADDPKAGAGGSLLDLLDYAPFNHQIEVVRGVLADEAAAQIRAFFEGLRAQGKK